MKKDTNQTSVSGALMVRHVFFDAIDTSSNPPFAKLFFSFSNLIIASERHLFSIKMKEKLKIKFWVGLGRALLSQ